ncbi:MAG: hypothetical protein Q7T16_05735 [Candidatus Burarchaeum sp.]|nr:hypothetical protein [Candidatus Burarchaeum sp.]MDO8340127.1 hypothetical protein [Candidatus Burarchaeum sp.]
MNQMLKEKLDGYKKRADAWIDRHRNKFTTLLNAVVVVVALIGVIFLPVFNGYSVYDNYVIGPRIKFEVATYPPEGTQIKINYINVGGTPITNLEIRYYGFFDPELYGVSAELKNNYTKVAQLSTRNLQNRGDSGYFYIDIRGQGIYPTCELITTATYMSGPNLQLFHSENGECYYKIDPPLPETVCTPAQLEFYVYSHEIKNYTKIVHYPISWEKFNIGINTPQGIPCKKYELSENKEKLRMVVAVPANVREMLGKYVLDKAKLAKKYCSEGIMPQQWCIENNLD